MPDERIEALRREVGENPASRQFYQLGELLRRDGELEEAIGVLRRGLEGQPRYVAAWVALGRACIEAEHPSEAAAALRQAIELDRANPVAWRLLGEARAGSGDRAGALSAYRHALALVPGDDVLAGAIEDLEDEIEGGARRAGPAAEEVDLAATARIPVSALQAPPAADPFAAPPPAAPPPARALAALDPEPFGALAPAFADDAAAADVFSLPPVAAVEEAAPSEESPFGPAIAAAAVDEAGPFGAATPAAGLEAPAPAASTVEAEAPAFGAEAPAPEAPAAPPLEAPAAPAVTGPATVTMARLLIQQQQLEAAAATLERLLETRPDHQEARDLLELVRDMLEPLPAQLPPLSAKERKIAALQRWLASLTLGQGRTVQ